MSTIALRRGGALVLAWTLFATAASASAAAPAPPAAEKPSLMQAVQSWIAVWLPGAATGSAPELAGKTVGSVSDPDRASAGTEEDAIAEPQRGAEANPDG
jgi:hypothetical protein